MTFASSRRRILAVFAQVKLGGVRELMQINNDLQYSSYDSCKLDIYLPEGDVRAVFLYFHGGSLEAGDKSCASVFAPYLCERGVAFISANYRMYPSAKYPDYIVDAADAVKWALEYANSLGCEKIFVGGSSAGAYLSMMLCFDTSYLKNAGVDASRIAGYFHDAGQPTTHFKVMRERGLDGLRIAVDAAAPMYFVGAEKCYPPMRFIVSDNDMKNRYEQTMLMLAALKNYGHTNFDSVIMHGKHCEYVRKLDENGETVFGKMIYDFLDILK